MNETIPEAVCLAQNLFQMMADEQPRNPLCNRRFWETIRDAALAKAPLPAPVAAHEAEEPMGDAEAAKFAKQQVPTRFPAWNGFQVGQVSPGYWNLVMDPDPFKKLLARYLKSSYYRRMNPDA